MKLHESGVLCVCIKAEVKWCQFQSISGWNLIKWRHIYIRNLEENCFVVLKSENAWLCTVDVLLLHGQFRLPLELPWYKFSTFLNSFPHQQNLTVAQIEESSNILWFNAKLPMKAELITFYHIFSVNRVNEPLMNNVMRWEVLPDWFIVLWLAMCLLVGGLPTQRPRPLRWLRLSLWSMAFTHKETDHTEILLAYVCRPRSVRQMEQMRF